MKTVTKLWKNLYQGLGEVDPTNPLADDTIKHTMTPSRYAALSEVVADMIVDGETVIEIGCGYGGLATEILKRRQVKYLAVDNIPMLDQIRRNLGDKVEYVPAVDIETLKEKHFGLFISHYCLAETPFEYREYIMMNILKYCDKVFIIDLKDGSQPTRKMVADGYDLDELRTERWIRLYFDYAKTETRYNQCMYVGGRKL